MIGEIEGMTSSSATIVWFRQDLRLHDNPALHAALHRGGPVIPVYIQSDAEEGDWPAGGASRWWLHHSLSVLDAALRERGSRLILQRGSTEKILRALLKHTHADAVYWNRRYEPAAIARDAALKLALRGSDVTCNSFNSALLMEPWDLSSAAGRQYRVFTPFRKRLLELLEIAPPLSTPRVLPAPAVWPDGLSLRELRLLPAIEWYRQMAHHWQPGEHGALTRARHFLAESVSSYASRRDLPSVDGTSGLSPHLHFGEVSVRLLLHQLSKRGHWRDSGFVSELIWREFAHHMLYHFPGTAREPLDAQFSNLPSKPDQSTLRRWQSGQTGIPIVDAGMRQLWAIGWMHNRVRMIVASLLVKNLQQPWICGAQWFWDTLVDADLSANTLNWQWVAGCGADAAPYFRIFNPVLQGARFDPDGGYVRRWVPELAELPAAHIHAPHLAPRAVLDAARVAIGHSYPAPIVDLKASREQALSAYRKMRTGSQA